MIVSICTLNTQNAQNTLSLKFLSLDYDTHFNLFFVNYWHAILWVERHILLSPHNTSRYGKCISFTKVREY